MSLLGEGGHSRPRRQKSFALIILRGPNAAVFTPDLGGGRITWRDRPRCPILAAAANRDRAEGTTFREGGLFLEMQTFIQSRGRSLIQYPQTPAEARLERVGSRRL